MQGSSVVPPCHGCSLIMWVVVWLDVYQFGGPRSRVIVLAQQWQDVML